jgi:hypothetical protein
MTLHEKTKEIAKLGGELEKALAIQQFMPDAFSFGPCKVQVIANAFMENPKIRFILGNGEKRIFPLNEIPQNVRP